MFNTIDDLILARAAEMAAHDGAPVSPTHIFGAAGHLQPELIAARDRLMNAAGIPAAGSEASQAAVVDVVVEAAPVADAETVAPEVTPKKVKEAPAAEAPAEPQEPAA